MQAELATVSTVLSVSQPQPDQDYLLFFFMILTIGLLLIYAVVKAIGCWAKRDQERREKEWEDKKEELAASYRNSIGDPLGLKNLISRIDSINPYDYPRKIRGDFAKYLEYISDKIVVEMKNLYDIFDNVMPTEEFIKIEMSSWRHSYSGCTGTHITTLLLGAAFDRAKTLSDLCSLYSATLKFDKPIDPIMEIRSKVSVRIMSETEKKDILMVAVQMVPEGSDLYKYLMIRLAVIDCCIAIK